MLLPKIQKLPIASVVVLGLGTENRQFLEWAVKIVGINPKTFVLADQAEISTRKLQKLQFFDEQAGFAREQTYFGEHYWDALTLESVEYVIKAPGIWSDEPQLVEFRTRLGDDRVLSSLHFFFEKFANQIIGISGTKGKTTTAGLTAHILNELIGYEGIYCGNSTGVSPYQFWDTLDVKIPKETYFVIELSSFQLQDLGHSRLSPAVAALTNYYVDHLDQHATKEEYWHAKDNIYLHQSTPRLFVTEQLPAYVQEHATGIVTSAATRTLLRSLEVPLIGVHNRTNLALALTIIANVTGDDPEELVLLEKDKIQRALDSFENLPYRLELVRQDKRTVEVAGERKDLRIRFVNDGAATEPEAVSAAILAGTEAENEYLWVQFTGKDKGVDPEPVIAELLRVQTKNRLYRVDYCGEIGQRILQSTYRKMKVPLQVEREEFHTVAKEAFQDLETIRADFEAWLQETYANLVSIEATEQAERISAQEEYVLNVILSPCGSSFDEFENYLERSEFWNGLVEELR